MMMPRLERDAGPRRVCVGPVPKSHKKGEARIRQKLRPFRYVSIPADYPQVETQYRGFTVQRQGKKDWDIYRPTRFRRLRPNWSSDFVSHVYIVARGFKTKAAAIRAIDHYTRNELG